MLVEFSYRVLLHTKGWAEQCNIEAIAKMSVLQEQTIDVLTLINLLVPYLIVV